MRIVSIQLRVCPECGKEVPATLRVCTECGAGRPRTRREKEAQQRQIEPPSSNVQALTEAVRDVPGGAIQDRGGGRELRRRSGRTRGSSRHRSSRSHGSHRSHSHGTHVENLTQRTPTAEETARARAQGAEGPVLVKRVARRKMYRYGDDLHKKFAYGLELRAILIVLAIGVLLLVMCRAIWPRGLPDALNPDSPYTQNPSGPQGMAAVTWGTSAGALLSLTGPSPG